MASPRPRLRIGIVGCGEVAEHKHLLSLQRVPEAEVVAVADTDLARAQRVADRYGIPRRYGRADDLLADDAIDAVGICVPADAHAAVVLQALDAQKHILVEKPLALTVDDCDRMIERARQTSGLAVMVGFHMRRHHQVREAVEILRRGDLGEIESIRSVWYSPIRYDGSLPPWRYTRTDGGGALAELAVHHLDLWRYLLQTEVDEVFAMSRHEGAADETAHVTARLANGVLATGSFSERTSHDIEVEICGRDGRLRLSCLRFDGLEVLPRTDLPGSIRHRAKRILHTLVELPRGLRPRDPGGEYMASYQAQWRYFVRSVRLGAPVEPTLEDGRAALRAMLAAVESATNGTSVRVEASSRTLLPVSPER